MLDNDGVQRRFKPGGLTLRQDKQTRRTTMLKSILAAAALAVAVVPAAPAFADSVNVEIGGRHRHDIGRHDAERIAANRGVERVTDVDFNDGIWIVRGVNHRGTHIRVKITRFGRVIDVDYFRHGDWRR
jgi:hypothetical protein